MAEGPERLRCSIMVNGRPESKRRFVVQSNWDWDQVLSRAKAKTGIEVYEIRDVGGALIDDAGDIFGDDVLVALTEGESFILVAKETPPDGDEAAAPPLTSRPTAPGSPQEDDDVPEQPALDQGDQLTPMPAAGGGGGLAAEVPGSAVGSDGGVLELQRMSTSSAKDFTLCSYIGGGQNGAVFAATCKKSPNPHKQYAVKLVFNFGLGTDAARNTYENEYDVLGQLPPHPNIVRFWAQFLGEVPDAAMERLPDYVRAAAEYKDHDGRTRRRKTQFVILDYYPRSVEDYRPHQPNPLPTHSLIGLLLDLMAAIAHMERHHTAQLDLKLDNLLLSEEGRLVVCDFGCAVVFESEAMRMNFQPTMSLGGNRRHLAPEVLNTDHRLRSGHSNGGQSFISYRHAEVWAAGVIAHELAIGLHPFPDYPNDVGGAGSISYREEDLPALPEVYPVELRQLITRMLSLEPANRPSAAAALQELTGIAAAAGLPTRAALLRNGSDTGSVASGPSGTPVPVQSRVIVDSPLDAPAAAGTEAEVQVHVKNIRGQGVTVTVSSLALVSEVVSLAREGFNRAALDAAVSAVARMGVADGARLEAVLIRPTQSGVSSGRLQESASAADAGVSGEVLAAFQSAFRSKAIAATPEQCQLLYRGQPQEHAAPLSLLNLQSESTVYFIDRAVEEEKEEAAASAAAETQAAAAAAPAATTGAAAATPATTGAAAGAGASSSAPAPVRAPAQGSGSGSARASSRPSRVGLPVASEAVEDDSADVRGGIGDLLEVPEMELGHMWGVRFDRQLHHPNITLRNGQRAADTNDKWASAGVKHASGPVGRRSFLFRIESAESHCGCAVGMYDPDQFVVQQQSLGAHAGSWAVSKSGKVSDAQGWQKFGSPFRSGSEVEVDWDPLAGEIRFFHNGRPFGAETALAFEGLIGRNLRAGVCLGSNSGGKYTRVSLARPPLRHWDVSRCHSRIEVLKDGRVAKNESKWATVLGACAGVSSGVLSFSLRLNQVQSGGGVAIGVVNTETFDHRAANLGAATGSWAMSKTGKKGCGHGFDAYASPFKSRAVISCIVDGTLGTLRFAHNGVELGLAYKSQALVGQEIVPAVCLGTGTGNIHCEVELLPNSQLWPVRYNPHTCKPGDVAFREDLTAAETDGRWATVLAEHTGAREGFLTFGTCLRHADPGAGVAVGVVDGVRFNPLKHNLGAQQFSWGYSKTGSVGAGQGFQSCGPRCGEGDVLAVDCNLRAGSVAFYLNGAFVARPFAGIKNTRLVPAVCIGSNKAEDRLKSRVDLVPGPVVRWDTVRRSSKVVLDRGDPSSSPINLGQPLLDSGPFATGQVNESDAATHSPRPWQGTATGSIADATAHTSDRWCTALAHHQGASRGYRVSFAIRLDQIEGGFALGFVDPRVFDATRHNLGTSPGSWAYSKTGKKSAGDSWLSYTAKRSAAPGDVVRAVADLTPRSPDNGHIEFWYNDECLGVAFANLCDLSGGCPCLVPAVCMGSSRGGPRVRLTLMPVQELTRSVAPHRGHR